MKRSTSSPSLAATLAAAVMAAPGCEPETVCTLIGCYDGVEILIESPSGAPLAVRTATVTDDGGNRALLRCARPGETGSSTVTGSFLPLSGCFENRIEVGVDGRPRDTMMVELETVGGERFAGSVGFELRPFYPNGEDCPGECWRDQASVVAE